MGSGASTTVCTTDNGVAESLKQFIATFQPFSNPGEEARSVRSVVWRSCDKNGNGMCSLAEVDGWIKDVLQDSFGANDDYLIIWKRFRPCYIRAFNDANDIEGAQGLKGSSTTTDSYVTKTEFRLFCAYLCIYAAMFECFSMLDGKVPTGDDGDISDDDRRMSLEEFTSGWDKITGKFGFAALAAVRDGDKSPGDVFKEIDADGKGMVLLNEWCAWLEKGEIAEATEIGVALATGDIEQERALKAAMA
jgi:hypothetical protein